MFVYYCRFSLSYRDISEIMKERGISFHPTTIMRWMYEYCNLIYQIWKKKNKSAHFSWHLDETYIKVKGEWCYFNRAIDQEGYTLDIQLRKTRDHEAAYMFMKRLGKTFGEPTVLTTDKAPALLGAFKKLRFFGIPGITTVNGDCLNAIPHVSTYLYFIQTLQQNHPSPRMIKLGF
ncbi:IS6 family transposase [Bacillus cereus]|uniref:IS6 family transposase n=1 Tax=Bacillus cereus TaxID=1396 RepID=UPI00211D1DA9|nr:IS6 family transposase [Bacillus cereus]